MAKDSQEQMTRKHSKCLKISSKLLWAHLLSWKTLFFRETLSVEFQQSATYWPASKPSHFRSWTSQSLHMIQACYPTHLCGHWRHLKWALDLRFQETSRSPAGEGYSERALSHSSSPSTCRNHLTFAVSKLGSSNGPPSAHRFGFVGQKGWSPNSYLFHVNWQFLLVRHKIWNIPHVSFSLKNLGLFNI